MKILKILTVILFCLILLLPLVFFNFTPDAISEIDNRKLAENPFSPEQRGKGDFTDNIENYVNDRIGFREDMILSYTVLNDRIFNKMIHPSYIYGKDGYVFGNVNPEIEYNDYHKTFVDMIVSVDKYCKDRNIPFLFVLNPGKSSVYKEYIADGINYNMDWLNTVLSKLTDAGVECVDNTETFLALKEQGIQCYNHKYDANHWNDIGAFYGTNEILKNIQSTYPSTHVNDISEFTQSEKHVDTLLVSKFPIDENIPVMEKNLDVVSIGDKYSSLKRDNRYKSFNVIENKERKKEKSPSVLVFQGSYMNNLGGKYMMNALGRYVYVHDYQNIINFPYYFNIFKPEYVVFEVADYTFTDRYFNSDEMKKINYNPCLKNIQTELKVGKTVSVSSSEIEIIKNDSITTLNWNSKAAANADYVWLLMDKNGAAFEADMEKTEKGMTVSIDTADYEKYKNDISFVCSHNQQLDTYSVK